MGPQPGLIRQCEIDNKTPTGGISVGKVEVFERLLRDGERLKHVGRPECNANNRRPKKLHNLFAVAAERAVDRTEALTEEISNQR